VKGKDKWKDTKTELERTHAPTTSFSIKVFPFPISAPLRLLRHKPNRKTKDLFLNYYLTSDFSLSICFGYSTGRLLRASGVEPSFSCQTKVANNYGFFFLSQE